VATASRSGFSSLSTFGRRSPLVVSLLLHFGLLPPRAGGPCCFKIQPQSRMGHAHQLGLHAVWPVLRRFSAPIPGRLLLSANRAEFCPTLPFVYGCLNTLSINSKFLSNSRDILSHPSTRPLFGGFHCFGYSSDKRLWLPPSDKRLWLATPRWWSLLLQIHPQSRMGHAHQLGLQAVWPVLRRYSAPIPGRLLLSANRAEFCPILPFVYGCLNTLSINS
jgi:hypothetical protein